MLVGTAESVAGTARKKEEMNCTAVSDRDFVCNRVPCDNMADSPGRKGSMEVVVDPEGGQAAAAAPHSESGRENSMSGRIGAATVQV